MELTHKYLDKNEKEFKNQILMILAYEGVSLEDIKNIMIKARTVNALDSYDCNEEEELKEINKDKVMNLKKRILDNSMLCILVSQFILILILLGLKLIKGIQMNEWVGSCIIALALDAWFIKFVRKLNNANKTIICEKS